MMNARRWIKRGPLGLVLILALIGGRFLVAEERGERREAKIIAQIERDQRAEANDSDASSGQNQLRESVSSNVRRGSAAASMPAQGHLLQLNTSFLAHWNADDIFIDRMMLQGYPDDYRWQFSFDDRNWNTAQAEAAGYIDPVTGDLSRVPSGLRVLQSPTLLPAYSDFPAYFSGKWVMTWEGVAKPELSYGAKSAGVKMIRVDRNENRLVFEMPASGAAPFRMNFTDVRTPVRNLRLYRASDEPLVTAGRIWNPDFIDMVARYDVVRPMLTQGINGSPIRQWAEVAQPDDPHFFERQPLLKPEQRPRYGRYGLPYEFIFDLAVKSQTRAWLHIPIQIGSPVNQSDIGDDISLITNVARDNARDILASDAWTEYANEFVRTLKTSQYPSDRPLYIELGNEIWNYAWPFFIATKYAEGIAKAIKPDEGPRYGYGQLTGRMILALEAALKDTPYTVVYVVAGQTAVPDTTTAAYRGLHDYWRTQGADIAALTAKTGIALTTYHGGADAYKEIVTPRAGESLTQAWERAIKQNPDALQEKLFERYTRGGSDVLFTKAWLVQQWNAHRKIAGGLGVPVLGAYEGGSHDNPPEELASSEIFMDWWVDYHWGPRGTDVVRQMNDAIRREFPGVMLSNFIGNGKVGDWRAPWNDGHYSKETLMSRMWRDFETKPAGQ